MPEVDYSSYLSACERLSTDGFDGFKQDPEYTRMLEQVDPGFEYLGHVASTHLLEHHKDILPSLPWDKYRALDAIGSPRLLEFSHLEEAGVPGPVAFSHTLLRYICVSLAIVDHLEGRFKDAIRIVEVGAAYGGQCAVLLTTLSHFFPNQRQHYTAIDLAEAIPLQRKYLGAAGLADTVRSCSSDEYPRCEKYNLFVSSYCLGEIPESVRREYVEQIARWCDTGFVIWNATPVPSYLQHWKAGREVPRISPWLAVIKTLRF
jgi:hypothetical protein